MLRRHFQQRVVSVWRTTESPHGVLGALPTAALIGAPAAATTSSQNHRTNHFNKTKNANKDQVGKKM
jgi:hypothetical protein